MACPCCEPGTPGMVVDGGDVGRLRIASLTRSLNCGQTLVTAAWMMSAASSAPIPANRMFVTMAVTCCGVGDSARLAQTKPMFFLRTSGFTPDGAGGSVVRQPSGASRGCTVHGPLPGGQAGIGVVGIVVVVTSEPLPHSTVSMCVAQYCFQSGCHGVVVGVVVGVYGVVVVVMGASGVACWW